MLIIKFYKSFIHCRFELIIFPGFAQEAEYFA
jgi:hypothetical protein